MTVWLLHEGKCLRRCSEKRAIAELPSFKQKYDKLSAKIDDSPSPPLLQQLARCRVSLRDIPGRNRGREILKCQSDGLIFSIGDEPLPGFPKVLHTSYDHFACAMEAMNHCDIEYLDFSALSGFPAKVAQFAVRLSPSPTVAASWPITLENGIVQWCELYPRISFGRNFFLVDQFRIVADGDYVPRPGSLRLLFPGVPVLMTGERFYQLLQLSRRDREGLVTHSLFEQRGKRYLALVTFQIDVFPSLQRLIPEQSNFTDTIFGF